MSPRGPLRPDPSTQRVLDLVAESGIALAHEQGVDAARETMRQGIANDTDPPAVAECMDCSIDGPGGDLPMRLYRPRTAPPDELGVLLYFHGGGYVIGDLETHDILCRKLCLLADAVVVAIDYRLAPEHRYPAAVEDSVAAFEWVLANDERLAADSARVAVAGDSAGGTLAAIVAQSARDRGIALRAQALLYPLLDMLGEYASAREQATVYPIPTPVQDWFWANYFGDDGCNDAGVLGQPWASPGRVENLRELAPAYVLTAGMDPLRDQGAAYAERLAAQGIETEYHCVLGTIHGFLRLGRWIPTAGDALASVGHFLRRHLRATPADTSAAR